MKSLIIILIMVLTVSCALTINQLRDIPPDDEFLVAANYLCLYNKAVERAVSYIWSGPLKWHLDHINKRGLFIHPSALVEIIYVNENSSFVKLHQTPASPILQYSTANLIDFLKNNPCR